MGNSLLNTRDQKFVLYEQLGIEKLFETKAFGEYSRDVADLMLTEAEKMAVEVLLPGRKEGDTGVKFKDGNVFVPEMFHEIYKKFNEGGWNNCMRDVEVGGQGMPTVLSTACYEFFMAANFPFTMYPGLTNGAANLVQQFGTERQKKLYMEKMYSGEWGGTMCLTEPGAGTDVGALKTNAKRLPDGTYSITGTKIFISSGDHDLTPNIVHPVLARIEGDPPGTKGISIFIVPKYKVNEDGSLGEFNDVKTGNVEHKMGIKGSATCTLNFGDEGNCIGELLGQERKGMKVMFELMNEARLEVGLQGMGCATTAYENAVEYAKGRIQSAPLWEMANPNAKAVPIIQHPDVKRVLLWMKAHVEGMRALNYYAGYCMDLAKAAGTKEERDKWQARLELLIPVCKAYSSEKSFQVCSKAIDVYGGYGYCSEYPVEQALRDSKITTIYEGTNGIQALDLVGRKIGSKKGAHLLALSNEMTAEIASLRENAELSTYCNYLAEAHNGMIDLTMHFFKLAKSAGFLIPILNAQPYLELFGDVAIGYLLMQAAGISSKKLDEIYAEKGAKGSKAKQRALMHDNPDVAFYQGKIAAAKFFAVNVLSTVRARCEAIKAGDRVPIEMPEECYTA